MKPALLVIDVQKAFFKNPEAKKSLDQAMEYIESALELFRENKRPVVFLQHKDESDGLVPGTEDFDLPDAFKVQPDDLRITKTHGNAFVQTSLEKDLRSMGVDTVIITGFCAEWCVLSTTRGAVDIKMNPIILRGSIASPSSENIRFVESISEVISYGALETFLKALPTK